MDPSIVSGILSQISNMGKGGGEGTGVPGGGVQGGHPPSSYGVRPF